MAECAKKLRRPSHAGTFYAGTAESLRNQIKKCFLQNPGPGRLPETRKGRLTEVVGLISPHAGYMFSGAVAAHAYYRLALDGEPNVVVLLGPNHTGHGSGLALMKEGVWRTPLGDVKVDCEIAEQILHEYDIIDLDDSAHQLEHSVEVQLPFLQYLYGSRFTIVPICFLRQDLSSAQQVGRAVATVLYGKNAVVVASSDMTHYEPQTSTERKDKMTLEAVEALDENKFYSLAEKNRVSVCGCGPIAAVVTASKILGAKTAKLLCYRTSGDVNGDYSSVVGYAAVCFTK